MTEANTPSIDEELIEARRLLVEFIADQFDDGTRSQEYWNWLNDEIGTRLEYLLSDRAKMEELVEQAFLEGWKRGERVGFEQDGGAIETTATAEDDWMTSDARTALNRSTDRG